MLSGLSAVWSRTLFIVPLVMTCLGGAAWYVSRGAHEPPVFDLPGSDVDPVIPHRLHPPRREPRRAGHDATFAAAFERGVTAYNADDVDAAADAFEEAVRLGPSEPEAHINLGLVYMRLQRPEDGLRELAAGAALQRARDPGHATGGDSDGAAGDNGTIGTHEDRGRDGRR